MKDRQFEMLLQEIKESRRHTDATADILLREVQESRRHTDMMAEKLRGHTDQVASETRRYFDVVAESLRGDIRRVAEGVATVDAKHERFRVEVAHEFDETRSMIKLSYAELDRRLRAVETSRDH